MKKKVPVPGDRIQILEIDCSKWPLTETWVPATVKAVEHGMIIAILDNGEEAETPLDALTGVREIQ